MGGYHIPGRFSSSAVFFSRSLHVARILTRNCCLVAANCFNLLHLTCVTRKYDTLILLPSCGGESRRPTMEASKNQRTIVVSRIMERTTVSPPTLSLITRWYGCGRPSLSISRVCVGGEARLRPWLVPRKNPPKKSTRGEFSNYRK